MNQVLSVDKKLLELQEQNELPEETTALNVLDTLDYDQLKLLQETYQ